MVHHTYNVAKREDGWAVVHRGKLLALHASQAEAEAHVDRLARLTQASGHNAEVVIEGENGRAAVRRALPPAEGPLDFRRFAHF